MGFEASCCHKSGIGRANFAPSGSTMSPTRSGVGVLAIPSITRSSFSSFLIVRTEYARCIMSTSKVQVCEQTFPHLPVHDVELKQCLAVLAQEHVPGPRELFRILPVSLSQL